MALYLMGWCNRLARSIIRARTESSNFGWPVSASKNSDNRTIHPYVRDGRPAADPRSVVGLCKACLILYLNKGQRLEQYTMPNCTDDPQLDVWKDSRHISNTADSYCKNDVSRHCRRSLLALFAKSDNTETEVVSKFPMPDPVRSRRQH